MHGKKSSTGSYSLSALVPSLEMPESCSLIGTYTEQSTVGFNISLQSVKITGFEAPPPITGLVCLLTHHGTSSHHPHFHDLFSLHSLPNSNDISLETARQFLSFPRDASSHHLGSRLCSSQ